MCKCFQSCLETFYWHCFEKHCCYDESIALYSEEDVPKTTTNGAYHIETGYIGPTGSNKQPEKNNNSHHFDNMSFYDSVAIIAHRAIFTIEPLSKNRKVEDSTTIFGGKDETHNEFSLPIVEQPGFINNLSNISMKTNNTVYKTQKSTENIYIWNDVKLVCDQTDAKTNNEFIIPTITEDLLPKSSEMSLNYSIDSIEEICFDVKSLGTTLDITKSVPCNLNQSMLSVQDDEVKRLRNKHRKQSLHERRVSRSIHLELLKDHKSEVPIIRQNSIPKFYLDTPTENQIDSALVRSPSMALSSPVAPIEFIFDLKSVVQLERERSHNCIHKTDGESQRSKEFHTLSSHLGNKLKIIKRHASAVNLQNRFN